VDVLNNTTLDINSLLHGISYPMVISRNVLPHGEEWSILLTPNSPLEGLGPLLLFEAPRRCRPGSLRLVFGFCYLI
jgi:hypothetical protein